jgi:hypothetical protein
VPQDFNDVFRLLDFASAKIAQQLAARDDLGPVKVLRNVREGILTAQYRSDARHIIKASNELCRARQDWLQELEP